MEWEDDSGKEGKDTMEITAQSFELGRYRKGKADLWLYMCMELLNSVFIDISQSDSIDPLHIGSTIFWVLLLYWGYGWVWYVHIVLLLISAVVGTAIIVLFLFQWHWMIYAYPLTKLLSIALQAGVIAVETILLFGRKNLKYFVKVQQRKRKRLLDEEIRRQIDAL